MRRMYGLLAVPLLLLWALPVAAQTTGTVTGRVTHRVTNQPIVGAQVFLAGTTRGGLTGQDGRYLLPNVAAGAHEVRLVPRREMAVPAAITLGAEVETPTAAALLGLRIGVERTATAVAAAHPA